MKRYTIAIAAIYCTLSLHAQIPIEAGIFAGTTTYQGDLAENQVELSELHFAFGAMVRYHFDEKFKLRANVIYGRISGKDANAKDPALHARDWSFNSYIVETSLTMEYHPFGRSREDEVGLFRRQNSPYVGTGIGLANFDPSVKTTRPGDFERFPERGSSTSSITVPLIVGITFDFSRFFLLGLEGGSRITFNDYLDGVSKNGNPKKKDLFIFVGVSFTYFVGYEESFRF
ncbi:MAG: outer membrane beta-barrel protein [Lewinellaceae bacterium]|nr:outer membrane beta-barrel protein [Saprospiraceae bacterium]MCB9339920.1 outer membrane beta-barrel protein [Lewinellaceae bacterium]